MDLPHNPSFSYSAVHPGAEKLRKDTAVRSFTRHLTFWTFLIRLGMFVQSRVCVSRLQDEVGQGELVTTVIQLAETLVVADESRSLSLSTTAGDVALAEKCLTVAQTCLAGAT